MAWWSGSGEGCVRSVLFLPPYHFSPTLSFQKTNLNIGYTVACGEIGVGSDREGEGVGRDREEGRGRKGSGD